MNLSLFMLVSLIHSVIAIKNPDEKCEFKDTVDVTNLTRYANGSYLYQNIIIPEHKLAYYNYRLEFRNKSQEADLHARGCVCDAKNKIFCIKLCCVPGQYYNEKLSRCEKLSLEPPAELKIRLLDGHRHRNVNIFKKFVIQVGLPCASPETLTAGTDIWDIVEVSSER